MKNFRDFGFNNVKKGHSTLVRSIENSMKMLISAQA